MTSSLRGFAAMSAEAHRKISSLGGKAAQARGVAPKFTSEEAKANGAKGGRTTVARHSAEHMRKIGARGGATRKAKMAAKRAADAAADVAAARKILNLPEVSDAVSRS